MEPKTLVGGMRRLPSTTALTLALTALSWAASGDQAELEAVLEADGVPPLVRYSSAISIDGDRAAVSAPGDSGGGVIYIYERVGGSWQLETKFVSIHSSWGDFFGASVLLRGDELTVGVPYNDFAGGTHIDSGQIFVYRDEGDGFSQFFHQELVYTGADDLTYGWSLAATDDWLVVGAPAYGDKGAVMFHRREGEKWVYHQTLVGTFGDVLGFDVAIDGTTAVAGAPGFDEGANVNGGVYVFELEGTMWKQSTTLVHPNTQSFGWSVDVEGSRVLAGNPSTVTAGGLSGGASLFEKNGGSWSLAVFLSNDQPSSAFGSSVVLDDDADAGLRALIGTPGAGASGGAVEVRHDPATDTWIETVLTVEGAPDQHRYGSVVALDGDQAFLGSPDAGLEGVLTGALQVFEHDGSAWNQTQSLQGIDAGPGERFGGSIAVVGDLAVVGCPHDSDYAHHAGAAFVYERVAGVWTRTARITPPAITLRARFGEAVDTDGERILIGAPFEPRPGESQKGLAYIFERSGGAWIPTTLAPTGSFALSGFGKAVLVRGDLAIVGSPDDSGVSPPDMTGSIYVFRRQSNGVWAQELKRSNGSAFGKDYGAALAGDGADLFVSDPGYGHPTPKSGHVYHYRHDGATWKLVSSFDDPAAVGGHEFGTALAYDSNRLAATAVGGSGLPSRVLLYEHGGDGVVFAESIEAGVTARQVDFEGERLVVGHGLGGTKVVVHDRLGGQWRPTVVQSGLPSSADYGSAVALSDDHVLVGAPSDEFDPEPGSVHVYRLERPGPIAPYALGDGSAGPCPCGALVPEGTEAGCPNSTGAGGRLVGEGSASLAAQDLALRADGLPIGSVVLLGVAGQPLEPLPIFDGLLAVQLPAFELGTRVADGAGAAVWDDLPDLSAIPAGTQAFFQAYYTDPASPCGRPTNLTNALQVTFQP